MEIVVTTKDVEFIPNWNGNREQASPFRVTLAFLNTSQRTELIRFKTDRDGRASFEPDRARILLAGILKIEGLTVIEDGVRKEIRTARDLLTSYGLEALCIELVTEIIEMNPRQGEVEKNSSSPSLGSAKA